MDIHSPEAEDILRLASEHRRRTENAIAAPNPERRKSYKSAVRYGSCERKVRYVHAAAVRAAKHIGKRYDSPAREYHCKLCGFWHVANVSVKEERR